MKTFNEIVVSLLSQNHITEIEALTLLNESKQRQKFTKLEEWKNDLDLNSMYTTSNT